MTENNKYQILPYSSDYAASLAQMWNESDEQWPGTFTEGVPFTEERIVKWMNEVAYMLNLVVINEAGKVVAYGNLQATPNQPGVSCYVPLLNVHPKHQGKSLCRRMLQQMVDYATEHGYSRMTIGTWSGNVKSVPLYKKVGFFWTPNLDVGMENYIPAIRQIPAVRSFFEQANWYTTFKRELGQVEDDERHPATGAMKVYIARWEDKDAFVEAVIDREGQTITGLATQAFAAYAVVSESQPAQGLPYDITWTITNHSPETVAACVKAEGETGINITCHESFALAAGESRQVTGQFVVTAKAKPIDRIDSWNLQPSPHILSHITIGETTFTLATGLNHRPAVELSLEPEVPTLYPGKPKEIRLQIRSRVKRPLSGTIQLHVPEGLSANWLTHQFETEAEGFAGIPVTLSSQTTGAYRLGMTAVIREGSHEVTTKATETAVLAPALGSIVGIAVEDKCFIENDFYKVAIEQKGGCMKIWDKVTYKDNMWFREELGPPHYPSDFEKTPFAMNLAMINGQVKATLTASSTRFPGLTGIREVTFTPSPIIHIQHTLVNKGKDTHTVSMKSRCWMLDGWHNNGRTYLPHPDRLVTDLSSVYPVQDDDYPRKAEAINEQWAAFAVDSMVHGCIWTESSEQFVRWGGVDITSLVQTIPAGEQVRLAPLYTYCGPGHWADVRRAWQRLDGQTDKLNEQPSAQEPVIVTLEPAPVLTLSKETAVTLKASNLRPLALNGQLTLTLPDGWSANKQAFAVENLIKGNPLQETITLSAPTNMEPTAATLHLDVPLFERSYPVPLLRLGDEAHTVTVHTGEGEQGDRLLTMRNGRCSWVVAPDYHGGIIAWRDDATERNHLLTCYPNKQATFAEFTPFFGGIQPMLPDHNTGSWLGRFYNETFTTQLISAPDGRSLPWQGVQVATTLSGETFSGLRAEIEYLTLPGSNVLKVVWRMVNETAVTREARPRFCNYMQVDGTYANAIIEANGMQRKRTTSQYWEWQPSQWAAVVNPDTGRAITTISASGRREVFLHDLAEFGGHTWLHEDAHIPAYGRHEMIGYLVLTNTKDEGKYYTALAD